MSGEKSWICTLFFLVIRSLRTHSLLPQWNCILFILASSSSSSRIHVYSILDRSILVLRISWKKREHSLWNDSTVKARSILNKKSWDQQGGKYKEPLPLPHLALQGELCRERKKNQRGHSRSPSLGQTF